LKIDLAVGELIEMIEVVSGAELEAGDRMDIIINLLKKEFDERRRLNAERPGKGSGDIRES